MTGRHVETDVLPPEEPEAATAEPSRAEVFYVGREGVPLYPRPAFSGEPTVRLPLNEKVSRSRQERGFAYVTVARTGQKGWVENSQLKPKKTPPPVTTPAPAPPKEIAPPAAIPPPESAPSTADKKPDVGSGTKPDASIFDAK
jgi:hypothetical protein